MITILSQNRKVTEKYCRDDSERTHKSESSFSFRKLDW